MGRTRQWLLLWLAGWLTVATVFGSGGVAEAAGPGGDRRALTNDAEGWLDAIMQLDVPGVVGRFERDGVGVTMASGVPDVTKPGPVSSQARFRIGSVTKTFVATVVLQLVGEGRLALDLPVGTWLPGLLPDPDEPDAEVTVRRLLNHTAGLWDFGPLLRPALGSSLGELLKGDRPIPPARLVQIATDTSPAYEFTPGTSWSYSNTNYIVAGMLVEAVTGTTLGEQLERRIFKRLGLGHSSFPTSTKISGGHARGYELTPSGDYDDVTSIQTSYAWAAGGIVASANDVSRFFRALLGGQLLEPEEHEAMMEMVNTNKQQLRYGLGLYFRNIEGCIVVGHDGTIPGYHSKSYHTQDGTRSATVLLNLDLSVHRPPEAAREADEAVRAEVNDALCS